LLYQNDDDDAKSVTDDDAKSVTDDDAKSVTDDDAISIHWTATYDAALMTQHL
jgi:hypothetical protein